MNLSGKIWASAAEHRTRKELQQTVGCVQNSPELHYSNQCRRANTGRNTSSASDRDVENSRVYKVWSGIGTAPLGQVSLRHTARCLICTSIRSLTLKPGSRNQANVFPLRALLRPPVNIGFPQQGTTEGVKAFQFLCSKPPPENGGSKLSVHI